MHILSWSVFPLIRTINKLFCIHSIHAHALVPLIYRCTCSRGIDICNELMSRSLILGVVGIFRSNFHRTSCTQYEHITTYGISTPYPLVVIDWSTLLRGQCRATYLCLIVEYLKHLSTLCHSIVAKVYTLIFIEVTITTIATIIRR